MALDKEKVFEIVKSVCPEVEIYEHREQITFIIPKDKLIDTARTLKENDSTLFDMLTDVTAIDWYTKKKPRFEVVYFLHSNPNNSKIRLKVPVSEQEPDCPSVTGVWESANWYERETWDMYGIKFTGHPGLRRFYMPEDFIDPESGEPLHPLRKDFPLMGIPDSLPLPPYPERDGEEK